METLTGALTHVHPAGWLRLIPLLPLVGAALCGLAGARLQARFGRRAISVIAIGVMVAAAGLSLAAAAQLFAQPAAERYLLDRVFPMIALGRLHVDLAFAVDPLSAVMLLVITVVGTLIHVYATGYMADEPSYWRFFAYLNLFVFSMLLLVLGDSFLTLFFGWEGVGLCSYLLIGFWYEETRNARAGLKAFIFNRVGDFGFLAGALLLFWALGGSWSSVDRRYYPDPEGQVAVADAGSRVRVVAAPTVVFRELHDQLAVADARGQHPLADALADKTLWGAPVLLLVALLLFLGACGKSAQIPLYVWLPDAMAGPTPVSALIHAATMVTAGVYLIARLSFLFVLSPAAMTVVATIGVATALLGAVIGLFQYDIKRVLAYSTVSQLGFMFIGVGVGAWWAALFHLVTHACFKACLFLGSGSVIHGMHYVTHTRHDEHLPSPLDPRLAPDPGDPQDMRNMGGLGALMPATRRAYLVACWAIAGFPWAAGFYSKDAILAMTFARSPLLWLVCLVTATLTSFYMFRSYYLTFEGRPASDAQRAHVHESPRVMTWTLTALAGACLIVGPALGFPALLSGREPLFARLLAPVTELANASLPPADERRGVELLLLLASVAVATLGWAAARALYKDLTARSHALGTLRTRYQRLHAFAFDKFRVDELYEATFLRGFAQLARAAAWFDTHVVDGVIDGLGATARGAAWITGAIDRYIVDGAVNGVADTLLASGRALGRVQTGRVNNYVLGVAVGVVILIVLTSWL